MAVQSPVTPVRPKSNGYDSNHGRTHSYGDLPGLDNRGPKTAPILSSFSVRGQDFFQSPSPASRTQKTRSRQRVPSVDSVFPRNVMELPIRSTTTVPPTSDDEYQKMKAAFFASSSFQNSPSPDDLPPPDF